MRNRLRILYFLQFGIWGCYLTSLGQFLGTGGLGPYIAWFYAAIGIVSLITPAWFGHLADKYIRPRRLLTFCYFGSGIVMLGAFAYSLTHPALDFGTFYTLYLLFLALYMPTMALSNTVAFGLLDSKGVKPVDAFPAIRVWGTVGFIAAMWFVNSTYCDGGVLGWTLNDTHPLAMQRFQYNGGQLCCSGIIAIVTGIYSLLLPVQRQLRETPSHQGRFEGIASFFKIPSLKIFLIFAVFAGVCLQISNGYVTPFITHFIGETQFTGTFAAANATMLFSISQIAEALLILTVGVTLKRFGIKWIFGIGLAAWSLRFLLLGLGNPGDGLWMLVLSMIVYGVGFNFITIAGHLYIDSQSPADKKGFGQGAMMLMSNGIGATVGTFCAGEIINHWCRWEMVDMATGAPTRLFMGDWLVPWLIFAAYTLLVLVAWVAIMPGMRWRQNCQQK